MAENDQREADAELLRAYLRESLDATGMARIEKRLRAEPALAEMLESIRASSPDAMVHSIGMAWVGGRLTCPSRDEWLQYLNRLLPSGEAEYLQFHLEVVSCPFCQANVSDLNDRNQMVDKSASIAEKSAKAAGWHDRFRK
jgi:hypothetical protein